ncbi:MAG: ABC-2 family transporter protein [bacterium ADurb.Bin363]|nr:MAG: ABC-2 family transporter protein [bacterium ADurb.Bin363]
MTPVIAISKDTIREMTKRKLILAIVIAGILTAILFLIFSGIVGIISQKLVHSMLQGRSVSQEEIKILTQEVNQKGFGTLVTFFSIAIDLLGIFLVLLTFSTFLPTEIDRGTIKLIISKPVSRLEVVLGKFLAGTIVLLSYSILMGVMLILGSIYLNGKVDYSDIYGCILMFCKLLMMGSITMAMSMMMRPILASVVTFFLSGDIFVWVATIFYSSKPLYYIFVALYYILPSYSIFEVHNIKNLFLSLFVKIPPLTSGDIFYKAGYSMDIILIMLAITVILFNKKDLIQ